MEYESLIKSQVASRNSSEGLMWCKVGHVMTRKNGPVESLVLHRVALLSELSSEFFSSRYFHTFFREKTAMKENTHSPRTPLGP